MSLFVRLKVQYVCVPVALAMAVLSASRWAQILGAAGCLCAVVSIDLLYRARVEYWRGRWEEEHKNFQRWIRSDVDRRR